MNWFRPRQVANADLENRVGHLEAALSRVESELRTYQTEQVQMHDQVRKMMRRAVAAERNQERLENGREDGAPEPAATPATPRPWGARGRRLARDNGEGE